LRGGLALTTPNSRAQIPPRATMQPQSVITGDELLGFCNKDHSFCLGYVIGIMDDLTMHGSVQGRLICLPQDVQSEQILGIVHNYIRSRPANLHGPGPLLVLLAIGEAFPRKYHR
jgi:hypothetical protein